MITPDQIRAARALLRLSAEGLSKLSGVGVATVRRIENAKGVPTASAKNLAAIETCLMREGIEFIPADEKGEGVRFKKPKN